MATNPLRAPPKPFQRRPVKTERTRALPFGPRREVENPADYKEFPLVACTQKDIENVKHHVLKFQSKHAVDPVKTFTRPVRLHRKETRNLQYQLTRAEIEQRQHENAEANRLAEMEREKDEEAGIVQPFFDITKDPNVAPEPKTEEEKRMDKLAKQQANIAPDGGARKKFRDKRKTRQVRVYNENDRKLRYEEFYPWVMEDHDGKNTWVGAYEAASADTYCLLVMKDDAFTMIPADKLYKFTPRNKYATLTLEEAEARMEKHNQVPRWLMKHLDESEQKLTRYERTRNKLKTVEGSTGGNAAGGRDSDNDDLDFDEEFADDEEAPIIDGDEEENKESEKKMKKEMLGATTLGHEPDDDDDVDDLFGERKVDKDGERVRKTLLKTEGGVYDSDDEANPYLNDSDLDINKSEDEIIAADLSKPVSPSAVTHSRQGSPPAGTRLKVKSINQPVGFVVLKGLPSVLIQFPRGEWNPNLKRRVMESEQDDRDSKRIKLEDGDASIPAVKAETSTLEIPSTQSLLTEEEILSAVREIEKITAKELITKFKVKLRNPENKTRIKVLVKQLLKNQGGFLVPKDN